MGVFRSLSGFVRLRCTSADPGAALSEFEKLNMVLYDILPVDEVTLEFSALAKDWKKLKSITEKRGEHLEIIGRRGLFWPLMSAGKRPVLFAGILGLFIFGMIMPSRILFLTVEGNSRIPDRLILEAAEDAGLGFGTVRRNIRSEQIKNRLLDAVPDLKWVGVNTYGSRAVITVRERDDSEEADEDFSVRHIVAHRDGIITSCTVTGGTGVCAVGQAVQKGDVLISGYTDCGLTIRAGAARGEILAETNRNLTVIMPFLCRKRCEIIDEEVRCSLILGKKRINFYKGSGISGATCVKMSTEYVLRLPGGFELPVSLMVERNIDLEFVSAGVEDASQLLKSFASGYLKEQMKSGMVIQKEEIISSSDTLWILEGQYACMEDIGTQQDEKIGDLHGKADGTDRERRPGG